MSDGGIVVRPARVEDAERVAVLSGQLGYPALAEEMRQGIASFRQDERQAVYVAETADGFVIGWVLAGLRRWLDGGMRVELEGLVVDEAYRNCGAGRSLVQQVERWARERECQAVYLRSNVVRKGAHAFYEKVGYERRKTSLTFRKAL